MSQIHKLIGSQESFGIEFDVKCDLAVPASTWWGGFWLWADGNLVGNKNDIEIVSCGLGVLLNAAHKTVSRKSDLLSLLPANEALDLVMSSVYGDDDASFRRLAGSADLRSFEVLPGGGPFFDEWQAILLEESELERFIYRKEGEQTFECSWQPGTFRNVVLQAEIEIRKMETPPPSLATIQ